MDEFNTVILSGVAQPVPLSFPSSVIGTAAAENLTIENGVTATVNLNEGDTITFEEDFSAYSFARQGVNTLLVEDAAAMTQATIIVNTDGILRFGDGQADLAPVVGEAGLDLTIEDVVIGTTPSTPSVSLDPLVPLSEGKSDAGNRVILNGQEQTILTSLSGQYVGSGAKETLQVREGAEISFTGNADDRIELAADSKDSTIEQVGVNGLRLETTGGTKVDVSVNAPIEVTFSDGGTTVEVVVIDSVPVVQVGGVSVAELPSFVLIDLLDQNDKSTISDEMAEIVTDTLPPVDQPEVDNGTAASDNINADQNGATLSGGAGVDRFIVSQPDVTQFITIDDFAAGEQLSFPDGFVAGDVNVRNTDGADGLVEFALFRTVVTLSDLDPSVDATIFSTDSFAAAFGSDALFFG